MRYLTLSELVFINGRVLNNARILSGKQQVRDLALLEAAVARPAASAFGQDAYPTLHEKAAALFHSILRNHPFADGNKRTATVAIVFMFQVNGQCVAWEPVEALSVIVSAAEGRRDVTSLARWFPLAPCGTSPQEDAQADMLTIACILEDQRWLLDELSRR